jgi:hypothetical protein
MNLKKSWEFFRRCPFRYFSVSGKRLLSWGKNPSTAPRGITMAGLSTEILRLDIGVHQFKLTMNRKREILGDIPIDHWWIPLPSLMPKGANAGLIGAIYRAVCEVRADTDWRNAAETHLLARLLPFVRSRGAQSVFLDAKEFPARYRSAQSDDVLEGYLDGLDDPNVPKTETALRDALLRLQRHTSFDGDDERRYGELTRELFSGMTERWLNDPEGAVRTVGERWSAWMKSVGRRRGNEETKRVLDVLSYEAHAAMRRCYSLAWTNAILPSLQARYDLSRPSYLFLEHWHQIIARERQGYPEEYFVPMLGHCIGLHPAGGRLIKTRRGKELLGEWLKAATRTNITTMEQYARWIIELPNLPEYGRLLGGYYLAYCRYEECLSEANAARRGSSLHRR